LGIQFLRFSGYDVTRDMPNVIRAIENWIFDYEDVHGVKAHVLKRRFPEGQRTHPNPSQEGNPPLPLPGASQEGNKKGE
jgi:hypothetical protein